MSATDAVILVFSVCNSLRLFAYIPQIVSVMRDTNGASGVSLTTWTLFTLANGSTVSYAALVVVDWRMTVLFTFNTAFSLAIVLATLVKRQRRPGHAKGRLSPALGDPPIPARQATSRLPATRP